MSPGDTIANHGYRGGPFVIDAADADAAKPIIDAWNDQSQWTANPWAERTVFQVVTVHKATTQFTGNVRKEMLAAPTIAVFSDGHEDIATSYLRAAGIPQSNGSEFPASTCGASDCGPGTANPDMLTVPGVAGDMGTCENPSTDHENGALFTDDGLPAYCQIMSMHWDVNDRETVKCDGGNCPATQAQCNGETITYHGHEVVAEVRQFLKYPVHFFAECQAVNAYENTVPNPDWPYLDDADRRGHFLTTEGMPPACPCTDADFECVPGGCNGVDCCLPKNIKELGAGFLIAAQPASNTLQILHPEVPYNQMDGAYTTVNGSEPAYNLSSYLGTQYINDREVTFITGPAGPGDQDLWMSGYVDGTCDITGNDDVSGPGTTDCNGGKVSYLGGHKYDVKLPVSQNGTTQGTRMFLNALFEADCVTSVGQPDLSVTLTGDLIVGAKSVPAERPYSVGYINAGRGVALDGMLDGLVPANATLVDFQTGGSAISGGVEWSVGSISANPPLAGDPPNQDSRDLTLSFPDYGDYDLEVALTYRVGMTTRTINQTFTITVSPDGDGDGVPDSMDPDPNNPNICGDSDNDTCDDCSVTGMKDPANDGPDADGDGICDAGDPDYNGGNADGDKAGGCCRTGTGPDAGAWLLVLGIFIALRRRRP